MLPLDDSRWANYQGGYRSVYDASKVLRGLLEGKPPAAAWQDLWEELHHQGDVGDASYASVPWLLEIIRRSPSPDWNPLALVCVIELARPKNGEIPDEIKDGYFKALDEIPTVLAEISCHAWDELFTQIAASALALSRGQRAFAEIYLEFSFKQAKKWFAEYWEIEESQLDLQ